MIEDLKPFTCRYLPDDLEPLNDLALDVRWTWNHGSDQLWRIMDPRPWEVTRNPWWMLQSISQEKLEEVLDNPDFRKELDRVQKARQEYLTKPGWFNKKYPDNPVGLVAYFSMEFGLGEAIPLYAGGLGILAGDYLKTASDLNVPMVGVGLLYQHGYFRQILDDQGRQIPANPPIEPTSLPMRPVTDAQGGWLRIPLDLPGRVLLLRTWKMQVGRVTLYFLDSNDPMNDAADRSIISRLYDDQPEFRLVQEMILGISGWKLLDTLGLQPEICHINEGHAAFALLERARSFMHKAGVNFSVALRATRAGNVFTTHTAVAAGFDSFSRDTIGRYFKPYAASLDISLDQLLSLGRQNPEDREERFNMATLALRGSGAINAVSELHGEVSRQLFQPLFPRWPKTEVPVGYVTNGVHVSSWDSQQADELWMKNAGQACWRKDISNISEDLRRVANEELWNLRKSARQELIRNVRRRLEYEFRQHAAEADVISRIKDILDPEALTIGFARRFATYKRPLLLLHDRDRLKKIICDHSRPVQIVAAGKAHPQDEEGKRLVQEIVNFSRQPEVRNHVVFLPDYDIVLAKEMVQGIDLWINTPRRPWEACGTSGMKVLVNGGLNLSELDGWWAEAYEPDLGWAVGDRQEHGSDWDGVEAERIYSLLENEIIPEYYDRNKNGIPEKWVQRIRNSMCELAPQFSSNRMLEDYIEQVYLPSAQRFKERAANNGSLAADLESCHNTIEKSWNDVRFGNSQIENKDDQWNIRCEVFTGGLPADSIAVEIYADPSGESSRVIKTMSIVEKSPGQDSAVLYAGSVPSIRPLEHYSLRIIPANPNAIIPLENCCILWKYPI